MIFGNALRAVGIPRRAYREYVPKARGVEPWPSDVAEKVVERYWAGEAATAIAKSLGVSNGRVYKLLRERGVLRTIGEARQVQERRRQHSESARH